MIYERLFDSERVCSCCECHTTKNIQTTEEQIKLALGESYSN